MTLRRSLLLVFTLGAAAPTGTSPSSDPPPSRPTPANTDARWAAPLGCRTHHRAAPRNRRLRGPRRPSVGIVAELRWSHRIVEVDPPMLQDVHGPLPNVVSTDNGEEPEEPVEWTPCSHSRSTTPTSSARPGRGLLRHHSQRTARPRIPWPGAQLCPAPLPADRVAGTVVAWSTLTRAGICLPHAEWSGAESCSSCSAWPPSLLRQVMARFRGSVTRLAARGEWAVEHR